MNIVNNMNKFNSLGRYLLITIFVLNLFSPVFAQQNLQNALGKLCEMAKSFLGVAALVLVVLAGTVYAIGQVLGAETRARAAVWATAMLTGAVIGAIIYLVMPIILHELLPDLIGEDTTNPCAPAIEFE